MATGVFVYSFGVNSASVSNPTVGQAQAAPNFTVTTRRVHADQLPHQITTEMLLRELRA